MTKSHSISVLVLSAAMALTVAAAPGRHVITAGQVADAIKEAGIPISADQVAFLSDVVANTSAPALTVSSFKRWDDHRLRVRVDCATPEECLPFFVAVQFEQGSSLPPLPSDSDHLAPVKSRVKTGVSSSPAVRSGSSVTLLLDGAHVHVQVPVVCLENGAIGQIIRVTSTDHRQVYSAEIVDATVVRGKL